MRKGAIRIVRVAQIDKSAVPQPVHQPAVLVLETPAIGLRSNHGQATRLPVQGQFPLPLDTLGARRVNMDAC